MVDWDALRDTGTRGVYETIREPIPLSGDPSKLVLEGLLHYAQRPLPIDDALRHPGLFPFDLNLRPYDLRGSSLFEIHRLGLDIDMVALRSRVG